jgi:hypothetical protein
MIERLDLLLDQLLGERSISSSGLVGDVLEILGGRRAHLVGVAQRADEHALVARRRW